MDIKNLFGAAAAVLLMIGESFSFPNLNSLLGKVNSTVQAVNNTKNNALNAANNLKTQAMQKVLGAKDAATAKVLGVKDAATAKVTQGKNIATGVGNEVGKVLGLKKNVEQTANNQQESQQVNEPDIIDENVNTEAEFLSEDLSNIGEIEERGLGDEIDLTKDEALLMKFENIKQYVDLQGVDLSDLDTVAIVAEQLLNIYSENVVDNLFINLSNTRITSDGVQLFFEALKSCPKLIKCLIAENNNFDENTALIISENLQFFPAMEYIILDNNVIGDSGFLAILDSVVKNNINLLSYLSVRNNEISDSSLPLAKEFATNFGVGAFKDGIVLSDNFLTQFADYELPHFIS